MGMGAHATLLMQFVDEENVWMGGSVKILFKRKTEWEHIFISYDKANYYRMSPNLYGKHQKSSDKGTCLLILTRYAWFIK